MLNKKTAPTMTRHNPHDTLTNEAINLLLEKGLAEGLPKIAEMLLNAAMIIERSAPIWAPDPTSARTKETAMPTA
jgi:hypothetical protein